MAKFRNRSQVDGVQIPTWGLYIGPGQVVEVDEEVAAALATVPQLELLSSARKAAKVEEHKSEETH